MKKTGFLTLCVLIFACKTAQKTPPAAAPSSAPVVVAAPAYDAANPLNRIMRTPGIIDSVARHKDAFEVQIIYTRIDRDVAQKPHFTSWHWNVDTAHYFYPASTVKMPLSFLTLEKINRLRREGIPIHAETPYQIDSVRPFQRNYLWDASAPLGAPTLAHDIRSIFTVSDNQAYNHMFEFLGREHVNRALREKGYTHTGINRRFYAGARDNSYASPMTFYKPGQASSGWTAIWKQDETQDLNQWINPQKNLLKGKGYVNSRDSVVNAPFDFSPQNWFALTDMEKMLRAVIFPEATPARHRFDLTPEDYSFLYHYMGIFPRECDYPKYDYEHYWDGYVKFFMFGDNKMKQDGTVRLFNKVGEAYGTLTDVAYVVDFKYNIEFFLAATILCNNDGVFNDDRYDYDSIGFPFLAELGKAVYEYEFKRERKIKPDLTPFLKAVETPQRKGF